MKIQVDFIGDYEFKNIKIVSYYIKPAPKDSGLYDEVELSVDYPCAGRTMFSFHNSDIDKARIFDMLKYMDSKDMYGNKIENNKLVKFTELPLGARFKYSDSDKIWVILSHYGNDGTGLIAEYKDINQPSTFQSLCCLDETREKVNETFVIPID